ncbi:hypothetical protein ABTD98_22335, partial [Acinetobacter baumannii]
MGRGVAPVRRARGAAGVRRLCACGGAPWGGGAGRTAGCTGTGAGLGRWRAAGGGRRGGARGAGRVPVRAAQPRP